jgi:hypothetical protein
VTVALQPAGAAHADNARADDGDVAPAHRRGSRRTGAAGPWQEPPRHRDAKVVGNGRRIGPIIPSNTALREGQPGARSPQEPVRATCAVASAWHSELIFSLGKRGKVGLEHSSAFGTVSQANGGEAFSLPPTTSAISLPQPWKLPYS